MNPVEICPIGYVSHQLDDIEVPRQRAFMISEIIIDDQWSDALTGIEEYSHIFVLFWMHRIVDAPVQQLIHPRGDEKLPLTGVLATRSLPAGARPFADRGLARHGQDHAGASAGANSRPAISPHPIHQRSAAGRLARRVGVRPRAQRLRVALIVVRKPCERLDDDAPTSGA